MHRFGLGKHAKKSARCPFHDDTHNSFSVWRDGSLRWHFKCHACGVKGDEITFIELHEKISKRDAIQRFLDLAGVDDAKPKTKRPVTTFDWQKCVAAFTDKHVERVAKWRGYSVQFVRDLKAKGLIGVYDRMIAFPVHNDGKIVGVHCRAKNGRDWYYLPEGKGIKAEPLVFGEIGGEVHGFESTWDGLALMDKTGKRDGVIITRGARNAKLALALIPKGSIVYLWTQNDEPDPKTGIKAGENWQSDFCAALTEPTVCVKRVLIPAHDLNDWSRKGASTNDLLDAAMNAETLRESRPPTAILPHIILPGHGVTISECAEQIFGLIAPTKKMFMRGGAVSILSRDDYDSIF